MMHVLPPVTSKQFVYTQIIRDQVEELWTWSGIRGTERVKKKIKITSSGNSG